MTITIIGIGLIGGSLAISLQENGFASHVIGVDTSKENCDKALRRRLIDEALPLEEAIKKSALIVLATPMDAMAELLPKILDKVDRQVVIDVGSTKQNLLAAVENHPKRAQFVATHPMAGTEFSGPEAAIPNLFDNKCVVLCEVEKSAPAALELVKRLYLSLPMKLVYLNAKEHDLHTAYVSHISHLSSFALALTVLEKEQNEKRLFQLASGGFSSTVRLAKSSPDMWTPIFRQNKENVLEVLDELLATLHNFRSLLVEKDFNQIYQLIEAANTIKRIIP